MKKALIFCVILAFCVLVFLKFNEPPNVTMDEIEQSPGRFVAKFDVVYDKKLKLAWQDNYEAKIKKMSQIAAIKYCENLKFARFTDWRLPKIEELISIIDVRRHDLAKKIPAINKAFKNVAIPVYYWSSTSYANDDSVAWRAYFFSGKHWWDFKEALHYVRCVRDY